MKKFVKGTGKALSGSTSNFFRKAGDNLEETVKGNPLKGIGGLVVTGYEGLGDFYGSFAKGIGSGLNMRSEEEAPEIAEPTTDYAARKKALSDAMRKNAPGLRNQSVLSPRK